MTVKARKCKGCKALPSGRKEGKCLMGREFATFLNYIAPVAPCCPDKALTIEQLNYKLSLNKI